MYHCPNCSRLFRTFKRPNTCPQCGFVSAVRCINAACGYSGPSESFTSNNDSCPRCRTAMPTVSAGAYGSAPTHPEVSKVAAGCALVCFGTLAVLVALTSLSGFPNPEQRDHVETANHVPGLAQTDSPPELRAPHEANEVRDQADDASPADASPVKSPNDPDGPSGSGSPPSSDDANPPQPPPQPPGSPSTGPPGLPDLPGTPAVESAASNSVAALRERVIQRDPAVVLRIQLISATYPERDAAATVLIELLAAASEAPKPSSPPGVSPLTDRDLMDAIIDNLVRNDTTAAWQALHQIIVGSTTGPLPPEENTELLVTAILHQLQPETEGLRQTLLAIVRQSSGLPSACHAMALQVLTRAAQEVLSKHTGISLDAPRDAAAAGPGSPGSVGMPDGPGGASGPGFRLERASRDSNNDNQPVLGLRLTDAAEDFLWSPDFTAAVSEQLDKVTGLQKSASLLELAGNLPLNSVRQALLATLIRLRDQGTASLRPLQIADPGMIITLNRFLSSEFPRAKFSDGQLPSKPWQELNSQQITRWMEWMSELSAIEGRLTSAFGTFPVQPHRGAAYEYEGTLTISAPAANAEQTASARTTVHYARLHAAVDSLSQRKRLLQHYENVSSGITRDTSTNSELWIEGAKTVATGRRSINVRLTSELSAFQIEVLVVEAADPRPTAGKSRP